MVSRRVLARYIAAELHSGKAQSEIAHQLAAYVVVHRKHKDLSLIIGDIARNLTEFGHTVAYVSSARPLEASLRKLVERKVTELEGKATIEIIESVEPALLGGVVIETPNKRYDASLATKLKRLKQAV